MDLKQLHAVVCEALEVEPGRLEDATVLEELPDFDSLKVLILMVALDEAGLTVSQTQVGALRTYGDIVTLARKQAG